MKRQISRLISMLLIWLSFFSCFNTYNIAIADVDEEENQFSPVIINALDYSSDYWFSTELSRAFFSILLSADFMDSLEGNNNDWAIPDFAGYSSYVGKDSICLYVIYRNATNMFMFIYTPIIGTVQYTVTEVSPDATVLFDITNESFLNSVCTEGYYKNTLSALLTVAEELSSLF